MRIDYSLHNIDPHAPLRACERGDTRHPTVDEWHHLEHELFMLYDDKVPLGGSRKNFAEPHYTLWFIRVGSVEIEGQEGGYLRVDKDNWVLMPPFYHHSQTFSHDAQILSAHFLAQWPNGIPLFTVREPFIVPPEHWQSLEARLVELLRLVLGRH